MISPIDSVLFAPLFSDDAVARVFGDAARVRAMVDVESALARAEARAGVIPGSAADAIVAALAPASLDLGALVEAVSREIASHGVPVIPLLAQLRARLPPEAASWLHWGATTQDIVDTAAVLQLRSAGDVLVAGLDAVSAGLADLAERHRLTLMAARTHGQQALPMTFGPASAAPRAL